MLSGKLFMPGVAALVLCFSTSLNAQGVKRATFINTTSLTREDELVVLTTGTPANTKLITGIADFSNNISQVYKNERSHVLVSHGRQSENKDHLGMAVVVSQLFAYAGSAPDENSDIMK